MEAVLRIRGYDDSLELEKPLADDFELSINVDIELAKLFQLNDHLWLGEGAGFDEDGETEPWNIGEDLSKDELVGELYLMARQYEYKVVQRLWIDGTLQIFLEGISKL